MTTLFNLVRRVDKLDHIVAFKIFSDLIKGVESCPNSYFQTDSVWLLMFTTSGYGPEPFALGLWLSTIQMSIGLANGGS